MHPLAAQLLAAAHKVGGVRQQTDVPACSLSFRAPSREAAGRPTLACDPEALRRRPLTTHGGGSAAALPERAARIAALPCACSDAPGAAADAARPRRMRLSARVCCHSDARAAAVRLCGCRVALPPPLLRRGGVGCRA
eukprot:365655-Chlamydomonas_euryale.AAC.10